MSILVVVLLHVILMRVVHVLMTTIVVFDFVCHAVVLTMQDFLLLIALLLRLHTRRKFFFSISLCG